MLSEEIRNAYRAIMARCDSDDLKYLALAVESEKGSLVFCLRAKAILPAIHVQDCAICAEHIRTSAKVLSAKLAEMQTWADIWLPKLADMPPKEDATTT